MTNLVANTAFPEGHATNRPPLFDGTNYTYWKARMKIFLLSTDFDVWNIVETGYTFPTQILGEVTVVKPKDKWDDNDKKKFSLNAKAMNALYCALNPDEFNRVSACETAKEIWDKLETTHEGTSQVKEAKLAMFTSKYENFRMLPSESIQEMITRFTDIVNKSKALGKDYSKEELVRKILRSLPPEFDAKVTAIEESSRLSDMSLDVLVGNLITHESRLREREGRQEEDKKKKTVALKAKQHKVKEDASSSEEEDEAKEDDLSTLFARGFNRFIKSKSGQKFFKNQRSRSYAKGKKVKGEESDDEVVCHNCRKKGHIRRNCPYLKKDDSKAKKKNKSFKATTWDQSTEEEQSDESSSEEEEHKAHLCLMALGNPSNTSDDEKSEDEVLSQSDFDIFDRYDEMQSEFEKLAMKYDALLKDHRKLQKENKLLLKNVNEMNVKLHEKLDEPCSNCPQLQDACSRLEKESKIEKEKFDLEIANLKIELAYEQKKFELRCLTLVSENDTLKSKLLDLEKLVNNFAKGSKGLDMLLSNHRFAKPKAGLGYTYSPKTKKFHPRDPRGSYLNGVTKQSHASSTLCYLCGRMGHLSNSCCLQFRKKLVKQIWVPKGTIPDQGGPFWISKSFLASFV